MIEGVETAMSKRNGTVFPQHMPGHGLSGSYVATCGYIWHEEKNLSSYRHLFLSRKEHREASKLLLFFNADVLQHPLVHGPVKCACSLFASQIRLLSLEIEHSPNVPRRLRHRLKVSKGDPCGKEHSISSQNFTPHGAASLIHASCGHFAKRISPSSRSLWCLANYKAINLQEYTSRTLARWLSFAIPSNQLFCTVLKPTSLR